RLRIEEAVGLEEPRLALHVARGLARVVQPRLQSDARIVRRRLRAFLRMAIDMSQGERPDERRTRERNPRCHRCSLNLKSAFCNLKSRRATSAASPRVP